MSLSIGFSILVYYTYRKKRQHPVYPFENSQDDEELQPVGDEREALYDGDDTYTAKLLFYQSLTRHSDYMVTGQ